MKKNKVIKKFNIFMITLLVFSGLFSTVIIGFSSSNYILPPPLKTDIILEESIMRRMSIREFTDEPITDEELATILWAAHGLREDGKRTIPSINNVYATVIYVLKEDAAYTYDPINHTLNHYKDGDWRDIVGHQYEAPIQLGLCWNKDLSDINLGAAEIAQMCVNIYFMSNALNLGTVACGEYPPAITPLGIPDNPDGILIMPIGHPFYPYNFQYKPMWFSPLPKVQFSDMNLSEALEKRDTTSLYTGELSEQQESQLLWAGYGYSFYFDRSENTIGRLDRHRTIPSAHGYYPNDIYFIKESGIYRYYPNFYNPVYGILRGIWFLPVIPFTIQINKGDYRVEIAQAANNPNIANSPFIVIPVLDDSKANRWDDLSGEEWRWLWLFDASSSANNILLEATALDLYGNIVLPVDTNSIKSLLKLKEDQYPLLILPISDTIAD
jgi:nitroreductase